MVELLRKLFTFEDQEVVKKSIFEFIKNNLIYKLL